MTGAGAGIGKAAALAFAKHGADGVVINSRSQSGEAVCEEIEAMGCKSLFVQGDVSTVYGAETLISTAIETFGGIDVLVNAAGIVKGGSIEQCTVEDWDQSMVVNVKSVFLTSKLALNTLRQRKGVIVNVTSTVAVKGVVNRAAYSASKGAVLSLSRSIAAEYVGDGLRVNCVCPGTVLSPSLQGRIAGTPNPEQTMKDYVKRQPMGRLGTPEEIAEAILFAASPNVTFMTGANLIIDGAMTL